MNISIETDRIGAGTTAKSAPAAPQRTAGAGLLATTAAMLGACGGGGDVPPPAFLQIDSARPGKHILAAGSDAGFSASVPMPSTSELLDWAELAYPTLFPGHQPDLVLAPYIYRHYPQSGNYVGVADGNVYIMGPVSGGPLTLVGAVADFAARVAARHQAFSDAQAARFLNQATLGATDGEIAAVRTLGYAAWLEQQFARPLSAGNWDWLVAKGFDVNPDARNAAIGVDAQIWQRLLTAPDSLRQRVALALSEIFVVGLDGITGGYRQFQLAAWWDLLVAGAFGSFRALLEAVTLNPAMGRYLNMAGNQKEDAASGRLPDENYAREVMQLFTIGLVELHPDGSARVDASGHVIESYTQQTVTQLARVFTGWNLDLRRNESGPESVRRPMVLNAALHSTQAASFLGTTVPAGTPGATALRTALDALAAHPNTGPFIGRQLIQRLVTSNPSARYVGRVAAVFDDNGQGMRGDLKAVIRAILLDEEARSDAGLSDPAFGKLREPLLRFVQWARTFNAASASSDWNVGNVSDPATALGQSPLRPASVFNFFRPGYVPPNSAIGNAAMVAPEFQITNESSVAGYLNYMLVASAGNHRDVKPDYAAESALAGDAAALLDRIERLLCAYQLTPATRSTIRGAIESISATTAAGRNSRVFTAVLLVMAAPEYLVQK